MPINDDGRARDPLTPWLARWGLILDGAPFDSLAGRLAPVTFEGRPAMLKVSHAPEEVRGAQLMRWWAGEGAAGVLALEGDALLLERACGGGDLAQIARSGRDDEATKILCAVAERLHAPRHREPPSTLVPLETWFQALWPVAEARGGDFTRSAQIARGLLAEPRDPVVLHGDLHHGNALDFGPRGWLAIDPKGLFGERGFDFANMVCNPDVETATAPGRLERQVALLAKAGGLDPIRQMRWVAAYLGLSASWTLGAGDDPWRALAILRLALAALDGR